MDQPLISAGLEQLLQFAILLFVVVGFFRQFATQRDIKKLDDRLVKLETGQTEMNARLDQVDNRLNQVDNRLNQVDTRLDRIEKKADEALDLHKTVQVDLKVLQASVNRLESYFETPKLKTS